MFPCLPTRGNIVAETKFASREAKMFPIANSETFDVTLCFSLMFPSVRPLLETWRNIGRKQCFLVCPGLNTRSKLTLPLGYDYIQFFKFFDTFFKRQTNLKSMFSALSVK